MLGLFFFLQFILLVLGEWERSYEQLQSNHCQTPDLNPGLCTPIHHCHSMINFLHGIAKPFPKEVKTFVDQYACHAHDPDGRRKICCPQNPIVYRDEPFETLPDVSTHKNLPLLPRSCGRSTFSSKITHGERTGIFEFPWMALIAYRTPGSPQFLCGGSVINKNYILTAAHCLTNLDYDLHSVRVGEHNKDTTRDCEKTKMGWFCAPPVQDLNIEKVIYHENYDRSTLKNDIGLLRVSQINLDKGNVKTVCLPLAEAKIYNYANQNGIVSGWGLTEYGAPSSELLKVTLPFIPLNSCQRKYRLKLDNGQICAGGVDERDSCMGDSGGPLVVNATVHGCNKMVQQGVVSFGPAACGQTKIPGVYTKVASYMDWILDNLEP